jgi:hypothetical protein
MKTLQNKMGLAILAVYALGTFTACQPEETNALTADDQASLQFMYEEEKLARDVYTTLGAIWNVNQLNNIKDSEQNHMDAIADIMNTYEVAYDVLPIGQFNDTHLKTLYDDLVAQGTQSKLDALIVGATVEDLDIVDLQDFMETTEMAEIIAIYDNLQCGSRNHLRAYVMGITNEGGTYTPQFLTQEEYDAIIAGDHETCN